MRAAGFEPEDYAHESTDLWACNLKPFNLFASLVTQWSVGMGGRTGLRYEAIYPLLDRQSADAAEWDDLFADLRVMEMEVLARQAKPDT